MTRLINGLLDRFLNFADANGAHPLSITHFSTSASAKKCDFAEPRPPWIPL
jgi:hypothetical protein